MWRNSNSCALLVGLLNGVAAVENSMAVPQKIKHRVATWSRNAILGIYPKEMKTRTWTDYVYTTVHSSIIPSSQKMVTTQMSINKWMDKQNVVYAYNGILWCLNKEGNSDTCYNMDEPWWYYAVWNKPVPKGQILCDSTNMKELEKSNP